jgi:hypothetical protein
MVQPTCFLEEYTHPHNTSLARLCTLISLSFYSLVSVAMEVEDLFVAETDGEYYLRFASILDAPAEYVHDIVVDYKYAYRINPAITEVQVLPSDREDVVRVRNLSEHRVGPFRFEVGWVGDIEVTGHGYIKVDTIPEESDFESGLAFWVIYPRGERTWLLYDATLDPGFFIPPLIGDYILKKRLKNETLSTFNRIECYAKKKFELDMDNEPGLSKNLLMTGDDCTDSTEVISLSTIVDK